MELKLTKTFLSKRPSRESFIMGFIGLSILLLFFSANQETFSANGHLVFEKQEYWRAFTTTLLHADLNHLAHNAFFFTGLAALLNNYFGFWVFPVLSLFIGGLINIVALSTYPAGIHLVGVSGVIYFMASFWLTLYLLIERRQSVMVRMIHAVAVSLIFFFPEAFQPEVSYMAHGLGFLFGIPTALIYYFWNKKKIRAKDEWVEIRKEKDPMENIILLESGDYVILEDEAEKNLHQESKSS
jgi:rhomboid protease GluP